MAQGADESCDGVDDDCDGAIDENYIAGHCGLGPCRAQSTCEDGVESVDLTTLSMMTTTAAMALMTTATGPPMRLHILLCGVGACARPQTCVDGALTACEAAEPATALDSSCDGRMMTVTAPLMKITWLSPAEKTNAQVRHAACRVALHACLT